MKLPLPILATILLISGCSTKKSPPKPGVETNPPTPTYQQGKTLAQFVGVTTSTPMSAVIKKFGAPDADIGSGIHIYLYKLSDGSSILLGSPDGKELIYVNHRQSDGRSQRLSPR